MCGCLGMPEDEDLGQDQDFEGGSEKTSQRIRRSAVGSKYPVEDSEPVTCCCASCICSDQVIEKERCCCCFQVKCGLFVAGIFIILLWLILNTLALMDLYNDYFDWWYVLVLIILYLPLLGTVFYTISWMSGSSDEKISAVNNFPLACWLAIFSLCFAEWWLIIYIVFLYKYKEVFTGYQPYEENPNYIRQTKSMYIFISLMFTILLCFFFGYIALVTLRVRDKY